jgi:adenylate cyclase class IV
VNKHSELELKWNADAINGRKFAAWMMENFVVKSAELFDGTDYYFRRGTSVVRYRVDHGSTTQELTTKQRKSADSIRDRVEVNIPLDKKVAQADVWALMDTLGFESEVALRKNSHVFHVPSRPLNVVVALYDVKIVGRDTAIPKHTFLEVEVESNAAVDQSVAEATLDRFAEALTEEFGLATPLNESLYEMYTNKLYVLAQSAQVVS